MYTASPPASSELSVNHSRINNAEGGCKKNTNNLAREAKEAHIESKRIYITKGWRSIYISTVATNSFRTHTRNHKQAYLTPKGTMQNARASTNHIDRHIDWQRSSQILRVRWSTVGNTVSLIQSSKKASRSSGSSMSTSLNHRPSRMSSAIASTNNTSGIAPATT